MSRYIRVTLLSSLNIRVTLLSSVTVVPSWGKVAGRRRCACLAGRRRSDGGAARVGRQARDVFYVDGDPAEARLLFAPVSKLVTRLHELLREFPEQPILEQLLGICRRLLALPLHSPLARLLTGVELLHRKGQEWEVPRRPRPPQPPSVSVAALLAPPPSLQL